MWPTESLLHTELRKKVQRGPEVHRRRVTLRDSAPGIRAESSLFAVYVPPFDLPLDEIRRELDGLRGPLRIAIQRSKNPFNVGAIIRVAHSFLIREIMLIGDEPYYARASMGMEKYENITCLADEAAFLARCSQDGLRVVAIEKDHHEAQGLWDYAFPEERCVLVFGSENEGVSPEILAVAESVVAIPMFGINHSYPVSVAAGITMAEWARRYWGQGRLVTVPRAALSDRPEGS